MNEREKMHCYVQSAARLVGPTMFNIFTIMPPNIVTQKSLPNCQTIVALIHSGPRKPSGLLKSSPVIPLKRIFWLNIAIFNLN